MVGSRFTHSAESRYAPIEGEALAVADALEKARHFLLDWGIHHRLSSVAFPHSNCRAEVEVQSVKRLITGNVGQNGDLDT